MGHDVVHSRARKTQVPCPTFPGPSGQAGTWGIWWSPPQEWYQGSKQGRGCDTSAISREPSPHSCSARHLTAHPVLVPTHPLGSDAKSQIPLFPQHSQAPSTTPGPRYHLYDCLFFVT